MYVIIKQAILILGVFESHSELGVNIDNIDKSGIYHVDTSNTGTFPPNVNANKQYGLLIHFQDTSRFSYVHQFYVNQIEGVHIYWRDRTQGTWFKIIDVKV